MAMDEYGRVWKGKNTETGTRMSVYHSDSADLDSSHGAKYHAVCEDHGAMISASSIASAKSAAYDVGSWCEDCSNKVYAPGGSRNPNLGQQFD
jgi:hypothetical protein